MLVSLIIKLVNQVSGPAAAAAKSITDIGNAGSSAAGPLAGASAGVGALSASAGKASADLGGAAAGVERIGAAGKKVSAGPMDKMHRAMRKLNVLARRPSSFVVRTRVDRKAFDQWTKGASATAGRIGGAIGGALALGMGVAIAAPATLLKQVIAAGMKYDSGFAQKVTASTEKISMAWDSFLLNIGQAGVFDFIVAKLGEVTAWIDKMAASGELQQWANRIAEAMINIGKWIGDVKWGEIATDILGIASAVADFVGAVAALGGGGFAGIFNVVIVGIIAKIGLSLYGLATALGVVSIAGAPIWLVVLAIAALAAGAFLVYRNWDKISAWFSAKWAELKVIFADAAVSVVASITSMWSRAKEAFMSGINAIWNSLPSWMRGIFNGATFGIRLAGNLLGGQSLGDAAKGAAQGAGLIRPNSPVRPNIGPNGSKIGGALDIKISAPPGTSAKVTRLSSVSSDFDLRVGSVRAAA